MHKLYVYGTLRPKEGNVIYVAGKLHDLGWFPGLVHGPGLVACNVIEVDDDTLTRLDNYEGYREDDREGSLYVRERYADGWIYVYNREPPEGSEIPCGDWVSYMEGKAKKRVIYDV